MGRTLGRSGRSDDDADDATAPTTHPWVVYNVIEGKKTKTTINHIRYTLRYILPLRILLEEVALGSSAATRLDASLEHRSPARDVAEAVPHQRAPLN